MTDKEIRQAVLEVVLDQRKIARTEKHAEMSVQHVSRDLRNKGIELEQSEVLQAVDYLSNAGMLKKRSETSTTKIPSRSRSSRGGGAISLKSRKTYYTLSNKGVDHLEGETEFTKKPFQLNYNIHITAVNAAVVTGNRNIVNQNSELFEQLDTLQQQLTESDKLDVEQRQDTLADIESLKQQLAKPNPSKSVVTTLWESINKAATLAGAADFATKVGLLIASIF